jgi:hypothetical protein
MKTNLYALLLVMALPAVCSAQKYKRPSEYEVQQAAKKSHEEFTKRFVSRDPYRVIGGVTNHVLAEGWYQIWGEVQQTHENGVRIKGGLARPDDRNVFNGEFFVKRLPAQFADGTYIQLGSGTAFVAKQVDHYDYTTVMGSSRRLVCLDYGVACASPAAIKPTEKQIAEAKEKADKKRAEMNQAALAHHQSLAEAGDPYGWLAMGKRYLSGDGVKKDDAEGRRLLELASKAGLDEASHLLKKLSSESAQR